MIDGGDYLRDVTAQGKEIDRLRARLERAEKILRDWQKFELWADDLGDSADDQDVSDAHYDMAEERDAFLRGD